jgi:hypothetical protein
MTNLRLGRTALLAALAAPLLLVAPAAVAATAIQSPDSLSYVLMHAGSDSSSMSGTTDDYRRARALRSGREGLLYFRQGGTAYVIRDAETLSKAKAIFAPQEELGRQQAELGSRQAELGSRQAKLGGEQARLGVQQAGATPQRAGDLGRQQAALGRQQDELGRQQNALGREQSALGREQTRLGRIAQGKLSTLVAEALRRGVAQRVD